MKTETLQVPAEEWTGLAETLHTSGCRFITVMAEDSVRQEGQTLLRALWAPQQGEVWTICETVLPPGVRVFPSLAEILPAAGLLEREIARRQGLIPAGDAYPAADGMDSRYRVVTRGETVVSARIHPNLLHRGVEKSAEGAAATKGLYLAERVCGTCTVSHALAYALAVEQIAEYEVPAWDGWVRMLAGEMERLSQLAGMLGSAWEAAGFHYGASLSARIKEELQQMHERVFGHRFLRGVVALGGTARELTREGLQDVLDSSGSAVEEMQGVLSLASGNDLVADRFQGVGKIPRQEAERLGLVGIAARAAGVKRDARQETGYCHYRLLDYAIPAGADGDAWDRLKQAGRELSVTLSMILQIGRHLSMTAPEARTEAATAAWTKVRGGLGIGVVEAPFGELVHMVSAAPDGRIRRLSIRPAAVLNASLVPAYAEGLQVEDFALFTGSLGLCYACLDR